MVVKVTNLAEKLSLFSEQEALEEVAEMNHGRVKMIKVCGQISGMVINTQTRSSWSSRARLRPIYNIAT